MTSQLVYQRIRNRIIEVLEWLIECETVPPEVGMNGLINLWEDFVPSPLPDGYFPSPVFTRIEDLLIRDVGKAIDEFCDATPKSIKDECAAIALPQWGAIVVTARRSLTEMMMRGKMSEEEELHF